MFIKLFIVFLYDPFDVFRFCADIPYVIYGIDNLHHLFFFFLFFFLAVLGLRFCARAFSSCGKRGPRFIAVRGPLTIAASLVGSTGSRYAGSVVVAYRPSCAVACGIFPHQGSNPRPLHWQVDSQPLRHQGSPASSLFISLLRDLSILLIILKELVLCCIDCLNFSVFSFIDFCCYFISSFCLLWIYFILLFLLKVVVNMIDLRLFCFSNVSI